MLSGCPSMSAVTWRPNAASLSLTPIPMALDQWARVATAVLHYLAEPVSGH
jgi:hypothetical protein